MVCLHQSLTLTLIHNISYFPTDNKSWPKRGLPFVYKVKIEKSVKKILQQPNKKIKIHIEILLPQLSSWYCQEYLTKSFKNSFQQSENVKHLRKFKGAFKLLKKRLPDISSNFL